MKSVRRGFTTKRVSQKRNSYFSFANERREQTQSSGFTLIELLVVISIIGLLSSIVLVALATARIKAYDAQRLSNMTSVRTALEVYYATNGSYPVTPAGTFLTTCTSPPFGNTVSPASAVIPGLAPTYLAVIPTDPKVTASQCCYYYRGTTSDYKFELYNCGTNSVACVGAAGLEPSFPNPARANSCAVYTPGALDWN